MAPEHEVKVLAIAADTHTPLTRIGTLGPGEGVHLIDADGRLTAPPVGGYEHFQ